MSAMLEYQDLKSPIHKLTGATKLIALIFWALASMITYDTRILAGMFLFSIVIFKISKVKFKDISFILYFILVFLIELFLVSPDVADKIFPWNLRTVNGYLKSVFIYVPLVSVGYGIFLVFEGVI